VGRNPQHRSFWLLFQPLPHLRFNFFIISKTSVTFLNPAVNRFTRKTLPTVNRKYFLLWISFALGPLDLKKKRKIECCSSVVCSLSTVVPFWSLKLAYEYEHSRRLSWCFTAMLPSGTHRKPIMSNWAVLLLLVTYLLTLPRIKKNYTVCNKMPCSQLKINWCFRGICCLHFQGRRMSKAKTQHETGSCWWRR
jgi:hypothetical protein